MVIFQSNAKLKLVRSLAVCEESSGPFSNDGPPESVTCFGFFLVVFFVLLWFASLFWRDLQCLIGKISKCTTCNLCNNEKRFSRISSSFTSAVHLTKRRRSPRRTSMKMKRRRRTRLPERCCHVVRCKLSLHKSIFSYQHLNAVWLCPPLPFCSFNRLQSGIYWLHRHRRSRVSGQHTEKQSQVRVWRINMLVIRRAQ